MARALLSAGALVAGCAAPPQQAPASAVESAADAGSPTSEDNACSATPDRAPLRLLTREEYNRTLQDLLGIGDEPLALPTAAPGRGFDNAADRVSANPALVEQYLDIAESIAIGQDIPALVESVGVCTDGAACAEEFVDRFGLRAYRRPVAADEKSGLLQVFEAGSGSGGFQEGIRWVLMAMLQSPNFLYRIEEGTPRGDGVSTLDNFEIATRLSYFLLGSMPDPELFDLAGREEALSSDEIGVQARRLLGTQRARENVANMHRQWFQVDRMAQLTKDAAMFTSFDSMRIDLADQTLGYLEHQVFEGGTIADIFYSDQVFVNRRLAEYYTGAEHPNLSPEMEMHEAGPLGMTNHRGVLLMGAFLSINAHARYTSPVHRGRFVREQVLCEKLPDPPNDVPALNPPDESANIRTRLDQHSTDPICAACHSLMDPVGFAFENYDAVGLYREQDEHGEIDATGHVTGFGDSLSTLEVDGALPLVEAFAASPQVAECVTERWMQYALGRELRPDDVCAKETVLSMAPSGEGQLTALLVAIAQSDVFRLRATPEAQGGCE